MKIKSLLIILSVLVSHLCDAQLFNRRVLTSTYYWQSFPSPQITSKTVAKDDTGNIFVVSTNDLNGYPQIIKLSPSGTFLQAREIDPANFGVQYLLFKSIIHTYDDGLLVIGNYVNGAFPAGYPPAINGANPLSAIFYAKFDNNLNLLSFKVHCGYPHISMQPISNGEIQFVKDIAIVPDSNGYDNYYILSMNEGSMYTTPALIVSVLNQNLVPLAERVFPNDSVVYFDGWHIDYLNNHGKLAINGIYIAIADSTLHPAILTIDKNLNILTPLTVIDRPVLANGYKLTNTIEELGANNLIWGFNVDPNFESCIDTTAFHSYLIKQDINTLSYVLSREYDFCSSSGAFPVELHHNSLNPQNGFVMGLSSWTPAGTCDPSLLHLGYNLAPTNYHVYDLGNDFLNSLLSMIPYNSNFVLHSDAGNSSIQVIKTDNSGRSYCSERYQAISQKITPQLFHVTIEWDPSSVEAYDTIPVISNEIYSMDSCFTMGNKQPTTGIAGVSSSNMKIYPNPVNGNYLFIEGDMQDGTGFILKNLFGSTVYKAEIDSNKNRIRLDLSNISPGMYVLKILSGGKLQRVEKIVIQ